MSLTSVRRSSHQIKIRQKLSKVIKTIIYKLWRFWSENWCQTKVVKLVPHDFASVTSWRSSVFTGSCFKRSLARRSFDSSTCEVTVVWDQNCFSFTWKSNAKLISTGKWTSILDCFSFLDWSLQRLCRVFAEKVLGTFCKMYPLPTFKQSQPSWNTNACGGYTPYNLKSCSSTAANLKSRSTANAADSASFFTMATSQVSMLSSLMFASKADRTLKLPRVLAAS